MKNFIALLIFSCALLLSAVSAQVQAASPAEDEVTLMVDIDESDPVYPASVADAGETEGEAVEEADSGGLFSMLGDELLNVILFIITTLFSGLWLIARNKLKQVGELFLKAYEYTDDNKLSEAERTDLINRFKALVGKSDVQLE